MRYSSLRQVDTANVAGLRPAWTFRTGQAGSEAIPVMVDGVMYLTAPDGVYALVPETCELLWRYDASPMALRGLAYWPGRRRVASAGASGERLLSVGNRYDHREARARQSSNRSH